MGLKGWTKKCAWQALIHFLWHLLIQAGVLLGHSEVLGKEWCDSVHIN